MKLGFSDIAIIATALIILVGTVLTDTTAFPWVGQDLAAIPSFLFLVATIIFGAMLVARLKKPQGLVNLFRLHRKIGVFFAVLIVVTFIHGFWDRILMGEPFFWQHTYPLATVLHGWFALVLTIMALLQVIPSLAIKDRRNTRKLHMILGYALLVVIIIEIFLGIGSALLELAGG
jgi:cytochrome b561